MSNPPDAPDTGPASWFESAERDYAFGSYAFFGEEWGEKLIEEVKRLRDIASLFERLQNRIAELERSTSGA